MKKAPTGNRKWTTLLIVFLGVVSFAFAPAFNQQPGYLDPIADSNEMPVRSGVSSSAAMITVTNTNDNGPGSLRQAITDATPGDTIKFSITGLITLTSGQLVIDRNLKIVGPGASHLSISGNHASGVFTLNSGITATLDGLTIKDGGGSPFGFGIANYGTANVNNCIISANEEGIFNSGNIGGNAGAGADVTLTVSNSTIFGNSRGILTYAGTVNVTYSSISNNESEGGIENLFNGTVNVTSSIISGNSATAYGGGIKNGGTLTVTNSTITANTVLTQDDGGECNGSGSGIFNAGTLTLANTTISDNVFQNGCIFSVPVTYGGGIATGGTAILVNTVVADNFATNLNDISGIINNASHNLIGDAASSGGIQHGVNGNIVGKNPLLGPLRNNGGPTMTHALLAGSPAINAGDNAFAIVPTDQRGAGFARIVGGTVDIGSYELKQIRP
jgi:hypothetical protein